MPPSIACAFRCSQPPGAFIRPELAGLVSCQIRSWGPPPELCSTRAAVRRFRRRSPHGVLTAFRVLLHSGIRHQVQLFKPNPARSSPGAFSLQGFHPLRDGPDFAEPPLMRFASTRRKRRWIPASGCPSRRDWLVSFKTADPRGISGLT
jgi:hypothetical protein